MQEISIDKHLESKHLDILFNSYLVAEGVKRRNRIIESEPSIDDIKKAINNRKYVGIHYVDDGTGEVLDGFRLIEPLVVGDGFVTNEGTVIHEDRQYLRAFVIKDTSLESQFDNSDIKRKSVSKTKRLPYYRLFRVDRISSWFEFPKVFSNPRELYNPDDKRIGTIIASVKMEDFTKDEKKIKLTRALRNKMNKK